MKSPGETIAHLFAQGLAGMDDRKQKIVMNKLFGKVIQLSLMNFNEVILFFFEELEDPNDPGKKRRWMRYESHPTPMLKCKKCGWKGFWNDLPTAKMGIPDSENISVSFSDMEETVEKCPVCGAAASADGRSRGRTDFDARHR